MPLLSFVIPCYRSEKTIGKVIDEIIETVSQREGYDYEIICVNDGSPDNVYDVLKEIATENKRVKVIDLAKNMGKHAALMAGFSVVNGEYIVCVDDDCQCPTKELWGLLYQVEVNGHDISTADYKKKRETLIKRIGSNINMKMAEVMMGGDKNIKLNNFIVFKRYVVENIKKYKNPYPYIYGLIFRVTKDVVAVPMEERNRGDDKASGFTVGKSVSLFLNGFTAFSVLPLRVATLCGFIFSFMGMTLGCYFVFRKMLYPNVLMGYSSLVSLLLFTTGIIMILLGMIGEYIGRIYICINESPQYVIKERINI